MKSTTRRPPGRTAALSTKTGPVRFAVIGLGHIAQAAVLPAFAHAKPHATLAALVSDDSRKLSALGRRYGVDKFSDYAGAAQLFESGEIDAVYIALPNSLHAEWTLRAANAGLHVLCEKPLAASRRDCERMIAACDANDVRLMTAYRLHFERCNLEVADLVRKRRIGDARYFDSQFSMQVKPGNVRLDRELGGGPLEDIGIYCINAARYVFAAEPTEVWATATNSGDKRFTEVAETVHAILKFPDNRAANIICSFGAADRARYEIVGTKGAVNADPAFHYAQPLGYELTVGERKRRKQFAKRDQFAAELVHFANCVRKGTNPGPSGKEGLIDVAIIEALHRSIGSGRWVTLNLPEKIRRPSLKQELRKPAVPREPNLVGVESAHS
jgi:predicted dehydrogenase